MVLEAINIRKDESEKLIAFFYLCFLVNKGKITYKCDLSQKLITRHYLPRSNQIEEKETKAEKNNY